MRRTKHITRTIWQIPTFHSGRSSHGPCWLCVSVPVCLPFGHDTLWPKIPFLRTWAYSPKDIYAWGSMTRTKDKEDTHGQILRRFRWRDTWPNNEKKGKTIFDVREAAMRLSLHELTKKRKFNETCNYWAQTVKIHKHVNGKIII